MLWRFVSFMFSQLGAGALGWYFAPGSYQMAGLLAGVVLGALTWFVVDLARGVKFLEWLRAGDVSDAAMSHGLWGEVSDRTRRLVRSRERETLESQNRLNDFLAALQASPNGVVLLDSQGRIEWFIR